MQEAIAAVNSSDCLTWIEAARQYKVNYQVLLAYAKGIPPNKSRGGKNTRLNSAQEATLKLYCKRCILAGQNPERRHI
jgi:hypothetical protein